MQYDLSNLKKLSDNDETFILDMLQTFKRTSPPILQRMEEYAALQKFDAVGREAHKMIPGVSFLGALGLKEVLINIEEAAKKNEETEKIPQLVKEAVLQSYSLIECFERDFPGKI